MGKFKSKKVNELKNKGTKKEKSKKKKRSYMLRLETIKKLKKIEIEEMEQDITLSDIVDEAINYYYESKYSKEGKNKNEPVKGQTKIDC